VTGKEARRKLPRALGFGRAICGDLVQAECREWWLANGLGGYAGGTIAGSLTRRYHGLLVVPVEPPLGRVLASPRRMRPWSRVIGSSPCTPTAGVAGR